MNSHWIKLDVETKEKKGVSDQISLKEPILAYPPREQYDECYFKGIYANSHKDTMIMLENAKSLQDITDNIPEYVVEVPDIEEE